MNTTQEIMQQQSTIDTSFTVNFNVPLRFLNKSELDDAIKKLKDSFTEEITSLKIRNKSLKKEEKESKKFLDKKIKHDEKERLKAEKEAEKAEKKANKKAEKEANKALKNVKKHKMKHIVDDTVSEKSVVESENIEESDNVSEISTTSVIPKKVGGGFKDLDIGNKEAKEYEKMAKKEAKEAEKFAKKEAKEAEKEAKKEAKEAEKEAKKAEKEAKKEAKEAEKEAKKAEKEAKKAEKTDKSKNISKDYLKDGMKLKIEVVDEAENNESVRDRVDKFHREFERAPSIQEMEEICGLVYNSSN
jgi:hypothetical protein